MCVRVGRGGETATTTATTMSEDEAERQRREINAFAAMANGDFDFSPTSVGTFDSATLGRTVQAAADNTNDDDDTTVSGAPSREHGGDDDDDGDDTSRRSSDDDDDEEEAMNSPFSKGALLVENSGTFSRLASSSGGGTGGGGGSSSSNVLRRSNLEAAALALSQDSDLATDGGPGGGIGKPGGVGPSTSFGWAGGGVPSMATAGNKVPPKTPMHTQRVFLPRPLFFGPILPPRVLEEARRVVDGAVAEQRADAAAAAATALRRQQKVPPPFVPRIGLLPPQVRNLISAVRCYGYGIDILPEGDGNDGGVVPVPRGSPYVTVFCPKWSETCPQASVDGDASSDDDEDDEDEDGPPSDDDDVGPTPAGPSGATSARTAGAAPTATAASADYYGSRDNGHPSADDVTKRTERKATAATAQSSPGPSAGGGPSTGGGGARKSKGKKANNDPAVDATRIERDMFSMYARGEGDVQGRPGRGRRGSGMASPESSKVRGTAAEQTEGNGTSGDVQRSERGLFGQWPGRDESPDKAAGKPGGMGAARADDSSGEAGAKPPGGGGSCFFTSGTFLNTAPSEDSDDDSVVDSEMKKKVGVSENLNAALASLEADFRRNSPDAGGGADVGADDGGENLAQVPLTPDGGRPLSNHELMDGNAPLFGVDDPPLPSEGDLGNHETRDEQQRSKEQRRTQAIIEKLCPQNVFGPLACPNPALDPDDNHSWMSMSTPLQRSQPLPAAVGSNQSTEGSTPSNPGTASVSTHSSVKVLQRRSSFVAAPPPKVYDPRIRYGWWNVLDDGDATTPGAGAARAPADREAGLPDTDSHPLPPEDPPIQLPPWEHAANSFLVQTSLQPNPETLHEQNRPLSELHPATTLAQALPFLSDRPPSYRHIQIDTQAVGFPALGGEVEPLFCSLAIYHVETLSQSGGDGALAPIPDLGRCGKVTETLYFDVVSDPVIEKRCRQSLCPYSLADDIGHPPSTRCGVFPLPSNLSVHNLYAIITVSKVVSEGSDFEPYLRPKHSGDSLTQDKIDLAALRARAEKAASHHGNFIMPFAFGVAPLLQVFGAVVPHVTSSRAVQIPLFRFSAGYGERQIIDHIMVMLYPKVDHRASGVGGAAPMTNGGTAMLVMRSFGYLGLHEVVNGKSSLARDRLVDFTGERQLRRREEDEVMSSEADNIQSSSDIGREAATWRSNYVAEPTRYGGRCVYAVEPSHVQIGKASSSLYAQELAPLPLHTASLTRPIGSPSPVPRSRARGNASGEDIEPYFHTTFCNELVCHPRLLHHSPKGNIIVKVEVREIEWNTEYSAFLAYLPSCGPMVHNPRRGPFLVQKAYTSCSARCIDPHFLDEFKIKLPLVLGQSGSRSYCIFFTVYRLSFSSRKKWGFRFRSGRKSGRKVDEIAGDMAGEASEVSASTKDCQLIQLGCGFIPLEKQQALIDNGNHDVRISHVARIPLREFCAKQKISQDTLIVTDPGDGKGDSRDPDDDNIDDTESVGSGRYMHGPLSAISATEKDVGSESIDGSRTKQHTRDARMLLQVRMSVQSSLHAQNATLTEFLSQDPDTAVPLKDGGSEMENLIRSGKGAILRRLNTPYKRSPSERHHYEEKRLLISTVDIAKSDMCSTADVSSHLLRVCSQLWKVVVAGTGNHDLQWANPAAALPLRVNAFATLLQILGSSTLYFSKRGVVQLNGKAKWNFVSLSRVLALVFDEDTMFGKYGEEALLEEFVANYSGTPNAAEKSTKGRRRHTRSNFEFLNYGAAGGGSDGMSVAFGEEVKRPLKGESILNLGATADTRGQSKPHIVSRSHTAGETKHNDISPLSTLEQRGRQNEKPTSLKVDSLTDFKSALEAGTREDGVEDEMYEGKQSGNLIAASWIEAFGGSSRRWMTAPSPLATIREDADDDEHVVRNTAQRGNQGPLDSLDAEIVRPSESVERKQMRIPKLSTTPSSSSDAPSTVDDELGLDSKGPSPPNADDTHHPKSETEVPSL